MFKDDPVLKRLQMHRTTPSYKPTHGLALTWKNELISTLQVTPSAINMDESTSNNTKHVYTVLCSYYLSRVEEIVVEHLGSIDVPSCTSENLFNATVYVGRLECHRYFFRI